MQACTIYFTWLLKHAIFLAIIVWYWSLRHFAQKERVSAMTVFETFRQWRKKCAVVSILHVRLLNGFWKFWKLYRNLSSRRYLELSRNLVTSLAIWDLDKTYFVQYAEHAHQSLVLRLEIDPTCLEVRFVALNYHWVMTFVLHIYLSVYFASEQNFLRLFAAIGMAIIFYFTVVFLKDCYFHVLRFWGK